MDPLVTCPGFWSRLGDTAMACTQDVALLPSGLPGARLSLGKVSPAHRVILLMAGLWEADTGASLGSSGPAELAGCLVSHGPCWGGRAWAGSLPLAGDGAASPTGGPCGHPWSCRWPRPWRPTPGSLQRMACEVACSVLHSASQQLRAQVRRRGGPPFSARSPPPARATGRGAPGIG